MTPLTDAVGAELGTHTFSYDQDAVILYNLCVGASADQLELVYERDLQTIPTFACAMGLWAVQAAGGSEFYDPLRSLHAAQHLVLREPLPASGSIQMSGAITRVYDTGRAAIVVIEVAAKEFTATYEIYIPGAGGWGGKRSPERPAPGDAGERCASTVMVPSNLAALYRLTGDKHPVHIDPRAAGGLGLEKPILHGLCTLGIAVTEVASHARRHPTELTELHVRFSSPVVPGDELRVESVIDGDRASFEATVGSTTVLSRGEVRF